MVGVGKVADFERRAGISGRVARKGAQKEPMTFKVTSEFGKKHVSGRVSHFLLEVAMAMTKCWECNAHVSDTADKCPKCGAGQDYKDKHPYRHAFSLFVFVLIGFIIMSPLMYFMFLFLTSVLVS